MRRLYRSELVGGADVVVLLEVRFAGRPWRWSTQPIDVTDAAGITHRFHGALDSQSIEDTLDALTLDPDRLSASFDVVWPEGGDLAQLIQWGHDLGRATGELALLVAGSAYEDRRVLIDGRVQQPQHGEQYQSVRFTLEQAPWDEQGARYVPGHVDILSHSDAFSEDLGEPYPLVIGAPGSYPAADGSGAASVPGSPAWGVTKSVGVGTVDIDDILVCAEWANATSATMFYTDATSDLRDSTAITLYTAVDGTGLKITESDISGEAATVTRGYPFYVAWTSGGALAHPYKPGEALSGAGDVCRWMMSRSPRIKSDAGRWASVAGYLNSWTLGFYIDESVEWYKWLAENVFPLLPITVRMGPNGRYPIVWRWDASPAQALDLIEVGRGVERIGLVEFDKQQRDLISEVRCRWALDVEKRAYVRDTRVLADPDLTDAEQHGSWIARVAASKYGASRVDEFDTDVLYDFRSVMMTATWRLMAHGLQHRRASYSVPQWYGWLEPGNVVLITDTGAGLNERVALVRGMERTNARRFQLDLTILDNPMRDRPQV